MIWHEPSRFNLSRTLKPKPFIQEISPIKQLSNSNYMINVETSARGQSWRPSYTTGFFLLKHFHTYLTVTWQRSKKTHYTSDWQRFPHNETFTDVILWGRVIKHKYKRGRFQSSGRTWDRGRPRPAVVFGSFHTSPGTKYIYRVNHLPPTQSE